MGSVPTIKSAILVYAIFAVLGHPLYLYTMGSIDIFSQNLKNTFSHIRFLVFGIYYDFLSKPKKKINHFAIDNMI